MTTSYSVVRTTPTKVHITSLGTYALNSGAFAFDGSVAASGAWPANNRAIYVELRMPGPFVVARFFAVNGTNATGNVDMGLFDGATGTKLISTGSTARSGTSVVQYIGVTDQTFGPGVYWLGIVSSSTTGSYNRAAWVTTGLGRAAGSLQEDLGSSTLPTTMTGVANTSNYIPSFGITQSDSV